MKVKSSKGMILLFSMLLGGSAVLVATGVFTLVFSQVKINQNVQESYRAYFNGDTIMECMRLYFQRMSGPTVPESFWNSGTGLDQLCLTGNSADCKIECGGVVTAIHSSALGGGVNDGLGEIRRDEDDLSFDPDGPGPQPVVDLRPDKTCFTFDINQGNLCAHVEIDHRVVCGAPPCDSGTGYEKRTEIHVFGRNICSEGPHQVQRYLEFIQCGDGSIACDLPESAFCDASIVVP